MRTAPSERSTLSLHDALPISQGIVPAALVVHGRQHRRGILRDRAGDAGVAHGVLAFRSCGDRSEEHTSELQSRQYLVCRLLRERKNGRDVRSSTGIAVEEQTE